MGGKSVYPGLQVELLRNKLTHHGLKLTLAKLFFRKFFEAVVVIGHIYNLPLMVRIIALVGLLDSDPFIMEA